MTQSPIQSLTLSEFLTQPETNPPQEFIEGKIIPKPMPQGEHSAIQTELAAAINQSLKKQKIARAFCELRCTFGGYSIVHDLAVFTWERIPRSEKGKIANHFSIAPNWTIEILSPNQNQTKVIKNILHCLKYNTELGWLINPTEESVFVYYRDQPLAVFDEKSFKLPVPAFAQSFQLTVGEMFAWLSD